MIKKFYVFAWLALAGFAAGKLMAGTFDAVAALVVSIGAVALVYAFAMAVVLDPNRKMA